MGNLLMPGRKTVTSSLGLILEHFYYIPTHERQQDNEILYYSFIIVSFKPQFRNYVFSKTRNVPNSRTDLLLGSKYTSATENVKNICKETASFEQKSFTN